MESQIAAVAAPEFLLEMNPAVLTVRMREKMKDISYRDIAKTGEQFIKSLSTVGFSCKQMYATWDTDDILSCKESSLGSDFIDDIRNNRVDPLVITRYQDMLLFRHDFSL